MDFLEFPPEFFYGQLPELLNPVRSFSMLLVILPKIHQVLVGARKNVERKVG